MKESARDGLKFLRRHSDARGWVFEILRLPEIGIRRLGQIFLTAAFPGQTKGNHYHKRKREWFCVVSGSGEMMMRRIGEGTEEGEDEEGETEVIRLEASTPAVLEVKPFWAHALKCVSKDPLLAVVYVEEVFDENDSDTYDYFLC